jgi:hypothetical protein
MGGGGGVRSRRTASLRWVKYAGDIRMNMIAVGRLIRRSLAPGDTPNTSYRSLVMGCLPGMRANGDEPHLG